MVDRSAFAALATAGGDGGAARALTRGLKSELAAHDLQRLAALWIFAAASAPETLAEIYDGALEGWRGEAVRAAPVRLIQRPGEPIPAAFWTALWALIDTPPGTLGAGGVTQRTAELGARLASGLRERTGRCALAYPGCAEAAAAGYPARFTLPALAACPPGSLGGAFHRLIVDNGFNLEVLDRDALGLADLPAPHAYLNARILQCHDLWHIVGGYRTTGLHEVAISAFQAGQFGHTYSAMFLAMVLTRAAFEAPQSANLLLDVILSAWAHGRESPPLLGVAWETLWDQPVELVRTQLGVTAYVSPWPADLFEQMHAA